MTHISYIFLIICLFTSGVLTVFTPTPPIVFSPADYIFLVSEDTSALQTIGTLNPITEEDGIILSPTVTGTDKFSIDTNFNISTAMDAPDYETFNSNPIQFQISFTYTFQTHDYVATTNITIFITDVNDNSPSLSSGSYTFTFTEDLIPDSLIGFVSAVDIDGDPYNCISYSITPPGTGTSPISVTEEGGIKTVVSFTPGTTMYEVVATDSGVPPQSTTATLEITVTSALVPSAPEDPIFQQTEYLFFLREDVNDHTEIGIVAANRDPSIVATSSFLYSVPQSEVVFQIDASTGEVSNQESPFDFESGVTDYPFSVIVKLSIVDSIVVQSQDTSLTTVYLRNVNEHSPVVAMDPFSITMSADVPVESAVGKLPSVSDLDGQDDFTYSLVTASPFRIDTAGFIYLDTALDTSISNYFLTYQVSDKPLLSDTLTTSATLNIVVTPASVPPEMSLPTRNVEYTHTCASIDTHSFAFTWLPPTDNSNPTHFGLKVTCTLAPSNELVSSVNVTEPYAVVVVSATFDRFTQCEYLLTPYPEGPPVSNPMDQLSFNNLAEVEYSIEVTNQSLIFVQISNITMCLSDLHGNVPLFDTSISLSDASSQVTQFDGSYANYYNSETKTLSIVGHLSSGSSLLVPDINYTVTIQFPVYVNQLFLPWYMHMLVPIAQRIDTLSWLHTCAPAFYTFSLADTSITDQSCSFVFIHATTANSFYQSLLPSNAPLSITVRDTLYGLPQWDSDLLTTIRLTQICDSHFTPLYYDQIVQLLFLMRPGYTLSNTATPDTLSLTVDPMFICSLYFTPDTDISELTAAFQSTYDVTMEVNNDTTSDNYPCIITSPVLNQLIILVDTPNSQTTPAVEFDKLVPFNLTLECDWSLTPGGVYSGRGVITPLSSFRINEVVTLQAFTFQIDPIDDNQVPKQLLVPYGTINGDNLLAKGQHVTSSPIALPYYFLIGSLYTDIAYISNKGVIAFGDPFTSPYPEIFPGYSDLTRNAYIIAPFWANIDTTFLGEVSWQLHTDATLLSELSSRVGGGFSAQYALVVTWHKVRPYPADGGVYYRCLLIGQNYMPSCTQHNTFQAVVLSDGGVNTHVLFSYNCEDFYWSKAPFNAAIGFNAGGSFYDNHHLSTTNDVYMVPCTNKDGTEYPQVVLRYRVSSTPGELPTKTLSELCDERITADVNSFTNPAGDVLPSDFTLRSCPADVISAQSDYRFSPHSTDPYCVTPVYPASDDQSILCCYSIATGTFLSHLSTFLRFSPLAVPQYATYEDGFFDLCCATRATCENYYQVRPQIGLSGFEKSGFSGGFGDPHFTSFDGFEFTFNAVGEFVLTKSVLFEAQIRATQLDTFDTTYTSAIVLKSSTSDVIQIEIEGVEIVAYTTGRATLSPFPEYPSFLDGNGYKVSAKSTNEFIVVFSSGVTVKVALKSGVLNYAISLPFSHSNTLVGLLGNWNADQSDDNADVNGNFMNLTTLTPPERDVALDTFGKSWAVTTLTSLFQYPASEDTSTYTDTSLVPVYFSELTITADAMNVCGSSAPCLYDYLVAGDTILANNTLIAQNELNYLQSISSNSPPTLQLKNGTIEIRVKINVWYYFEFEVFDALGVYGVGVSSILGNIELGLSNNLTEFRKFYVLKFRLAESEKNTEFGITVWAQSRTNLVVGFSFILNVCDCEFGVCLDADFTQENFLLLYGKQTCVCNPGYTGSTCSDDLDACTSLQCYPEVSCVDLPPPSLVAECATCQNGTIGDGKDCEDFNECVGDRGFVHNCNSVEYCSNLIGSFECICIDGYERNTDDLCEDIDECENPICHQTCVNTPGSYYCDCVAGLSLSGGGFRCEPDVPCVASECDTESQICAQIGSNEICFCKIGFVPSEIDSFSCLDLNECQTDICDQDCTNQIGEYTCACVAGYSLSTDGRTCQDINECANYDTCPDTFVCSNMIGSFKCIDPLNPFPFNSSIPAFSLDVPAIVAGSIFAVVCSVILLTIVIYLVYKDIWRSWRRRGRKDESTESEIESGTNFNIFKNH